jgi:hypothetical protein
MDKLKTRKDKYINLGFFWLHYIHYYPQRWSTSHWGWQTSTFKGFSIDFYVGKHVLVMDLIRGKI